jgi:hypothetical protein
MFAVNVEALQEGIAALLPCNPAWINSLIDGGFLAMRPSSEDIMQIVVRRTVEAVQPEQVILFGSHARGDADLASD